MVVMVAQGGQAYLRPKSWFRKVEAEGEAEVPVDAAVQKPHFALAYLRGWAKHGGMEVPVSILHLRKVLEYVEQLEKEKEKRNG